MTLEAFLLLRVGLLGSAQGVLTCGKQELRRLKVKLLHLSTTIDCFGVHEVLVRVDNKKDYTFSLKSDYDLRQFLEELRHHPGKALNYLKRVALK
jgi:hypothetical protein